jgi:hypothetical protein
MSGTALALLLTMGAVVVVRCQSNRFIDFDPLAATSSSFSPSNISANYGDNCPLKH